MSIFNFFRKAQRGLGMTSKKGLEYRRFKLEGLEERTLLTAAPWSTGDDPSVTTMIVVTDAVPVVTEVDEVSSLTEVNAGDTVYVSVYVKSTDPQKGVSGGYCTLYFDNTAFTAVDPLNGGYTPSALYNDLTMLAVDNMACSTDAYISAFGGFPEKNVAFGRTQWALAGTQQFTVSADAEGDYVFTNNTMVNKSGKPKTSNNFIREDSSSAGYVNEVGYTSATITVKNEPQPADVSVNTLIAVSYDIPTVTEVDEVSSLTEVNAGDTVYVSVYVKSTDPQKGVSGGYCTLYFDNTAFTAVDPLNGGYTPSALYNDLTMLAVDNMACSTDTYISAFGGFPEKNVAFGRTQWALAGTQQFTVSADAEGDYVFTNNTMVNKSGKPKTSNNFIREDSSSAGYINEVGYTSVTVTVEGGAPTPDIDDVVLTGYEGVYDGAAHAITVEDPEAATDTILYSVDGEVYDRTVNPAYTDVGTYTTYVKVSREGYNDFYDSKTVVITPAEIDDVSVIGAKAVYDGSAYSVSVRAQAGDTITYSLDGVVYDLAEAPSYSNVGTYTTYVKVSRENYNDFYGNADVVITPATIRGVELFDTYVVYDGNAYSVVLEGTQDGDVVLYSEDGEHYSADIPAYTEVGEYQTFVKVSRANYYDWGSGAGVYIDPADIDDVTIDPVNVDYDGNAHSITVNARDGDVVLYSEDGGKTYSAENPAYTEVGVNFVYVKVSRANYNDWTDSGYVIINAVDIDDVSLEGWTGPYDGEAHSITVIDPQADTDEIFYSLDPYSFDLTENPVFTEAGDYRVWVKVRRANHNDWVRSETVTITGDEPVIGDVVVYGYVGAYDGAAHSITVEDPHADTDTILYSLDGETYDLTENPEFTNGYSWNEVYVKVSREGYKDWYSSAVVNIFTKTLTVDGTTVADKPYDGTTDADVTMGAVSGIVEGDDVTVTIASAEFDSAEPGVYDVVVYYNIEGEDAANYSVEPTTVEGVFIYDPRTDVAAGGYTVDFNLFGALVPGDYVVIDDTPYQIGGINSSDASQQDVFNAYTNGFDSLKNLAAYSGLYDYQEDNSVTINIVSIAPGIDDASEGITLWRDDVNIEVTQVWTGTVVGYNLGGTAFVKAINVVGYTDWDNQATIYVGDALDINYRNIFEVVTLGGAFVDGIPADGAAPTGGDAVSVVNINAEEKDINLSMANFDGENVFTGDFNVVANKADFTNFQYASAPFDFGGFTREGFLNLGSETDVQQLFIQIGNTQEGMTKDTDAAVRLAEGGRIGELMVQIDAFFTNGFENTLVVDNSGTIEVFNFETSSSVYQILQNLWADVMGSTPVPTEQELYYYYYDGETAASNPFNVGSDENITAFLAELQSGSARQQAMAAQIIARMKGMHDVADVTTLTVANNESGTIGEGLDKLWGFGGGVTFENYGTISCDIDSTDGQGADYFSNYGVMGGFASGSTDDMFQTFGGVINGDVSLGDGSDIMFVFDTTAFGGEVTFGDGFDSLFLWGSALGSAGTVFSATLADTPELITIYDVSGYGDGETTVTIDTVIPDTSVVVDFSSLRAAAYGEYGVAIGDEGDLTAVGAYTVLLDADTVLGTGDGKVVIFSGATADNFNMDAEFAFQAGESSATLTIGGAETLVIGGYEYSLLYDGSNVYLQRPSQPVGLADLIYWSVSAVDYYTGEALTIGTEGAVISYDNLANVTVTYKNVGDAAVKDKFFYSAVRVKNTGTGDYVQFNKTGEDLTLYERISPGNLAAGGENSFKFLIPKLEAGNYVIEIYINNRHDTEKDNWTVESDYSNNYKEVYFSVEGSAPLADLAPVSVSAVDYYKPSEVLDINGGTITPDNLANVTVTYENVSGSEVAAKFFYSSVSVRKAGTTEYVLENYERISPGNLDVGETNSFSFLIPKLEEGDYVIEIDINNRHDTEKDNWVAESKYDNNHMEVSFSVSGDKAKADLVPVSISAVDYRHQSVVLNLDGGTITAGITPQVTATFQNVGEAAVANTFFYSAYSVTNTTTGVTKNFEYKCKGLEQVGGTDSFTFLVPNLGTGTYELEVWINNRGETQGNNYVDESDYSNNKTKKYTFNVVAATGAALPEVFSDEAFVDGLLTDF